MNKKLLSLSSIIALLVFPIATFAGQAVVPETWFSEIIGRLMDYVVWPIFTGVIVIMFIYAGFLFLTAAGDPTKITSAKKAAIWAIVGIVVGLLAFGVANTIQFILGLPTGTA